MEDEIITPVDPQPQEDDVTSGDENAADSHSNPEVVGLKELLSKELGRNFPDDQTALASLKEMQRYTGKVGKIAPVFEKLQLKYGEAGALKKMEELTHDQPTAPQGDFISREQYETDTFFSRKPQLEPYRDVITAARTAGKYGSLEETIQKSESLKSLLEKAQSHDDFEKSKSVIHSNPRLGQVTDKITEARQEVKDNPSAASEKAVSAVIDAFGLRD